MPCWIRLIGQALFWNFFRTVCFCTVPSWTFPLESETLNKCSFFFPQAACCSDGHEKFRLMVSSLIPVSRKESMDTSKMNSSTARALFASEEPQEQRSTGSQWGSSDAFERVRTSWLIRCGPDISLFSFLDKLQALLRAVPFISKAGR